ncbi:unnamed protein product, partial [Adineta steineri]
TPVENEEKKTNLKSTRVNFETNSAFSSLVHNNFKWSKSGITVAGDELNQLQVPAGLYIDDDDTLYIADTFNSRIIEWKSGATVGRVVAGGNGAGPMMNQLQYPMDVIVDHERDSLIICDEGNNRIVQWPRQGGTTGQIIISDISCFGLAKDNAGFLYVTDSGNCAVRRWQMGDYTREGIVVAGSKEGLIVVDGNKYIQDKIQLGGPRGIIINQDGTVYVADNWNDQVMKWQKGATDGDVILKGHGQLANQFYMPEDLSFDRNGNLYVVDSQNHRVQKFLLE